MCQSFFFFCLLYTAYNNCMKRFLKYCWIVILAIVLLPITIVVGIYCFVCFLKEYPTYKKSYSKTVKRMKYSHLYFQSDSYNLYESLMRKSINVDIKKTNQGFYYLVGRNIYRFGQCPLFFEVKEGELLVSLDGYPVEPVSSIFRDLLLSEKNTYLLIFDDEQIDLEANKIDLSNFDILLIENSIEDFANRVVQLENQ